MDAMLNDLAGKQVIEGEDPRWISYFDSREILQLSGEEEFFPGFLESLVENNPVTGNLLELMDQTVSRMRLVVEFRDMKQAPSRAKIIQCCTAMHLTSLILKAFFAHLSASEVRLQLRLQSDWLSTATFTHNTVSPAKVSESGRGGRTVGALIDEAVAVLSSNPLPSCMYEVAYCSANLLLCAFSAELYEENGEELFIGYLQMRSRAQVKSALAEKSKDTTFTMPACFVRGLLAQSLSSTNDSQASKSALLTLNKLRRSAGGDSKGGDESFNLFLLIQRLLRIGGEPKPSDEDGGGKSVSLIRVPRNPLQERCKNVLAVLLYAALPEMSGRNCILDMFLSLADRRYEGGEGATSVDAKDPKKGSNAGPFRSITADFSLIVTHMTETLPSESSVLLLYALLHKHPTFMSFITSSDERTRDLLLAVLRGLYMSGEGYPTDSLYVLVISLLLLVQNPQVQKRLSTLLCTAPWYKEHFLRDVSAADLVLLVTLRVTMFALFRLHDHYLISNCFAIILDLAHNLSGMGSYVSERLSKVIIQLARRLQRGHSGEEQAAQFETTFDTLAIMLKLCGMALRPARRESNAHLMYALVHESERIKVVLPDTRTSTTTTGGSGEAEAKGGGDVLAALETGAVRSLQKEPSSLLLPRQVVALTHSFHTRLGEDAEDGQGGYRTADAAVSALKALIREETESQDGGNKSPEDPAQLRYSYSEGVDSSAFFTPLAWAAAVRSSPDLYWHPESIQLFDPAACGVLPLRND